MFEVAQSVVGNGGLIVPEGGLRIFRRLGLRQFGLPVHVYRAVLCQK